MEIRLVVVTLPESSARDYVQARDRDRDDDAASRVTELVERETAVAAGAFVTSVLGAASLTLLPITLVGGAMPTLWGRTFIRCRGAKARVMTRDEFPEIARDLGVSPEHWALTTDAHPFVVPDGWTVVNTRTEGVCSIYTLSRS